MIHRVMPVLIDDCAKDGAEEFLTKIPCGIEEISQSNQAKFNVTRSIQLKNSYPSSLAQSSIDNFLCDISSLYFLCLPLH